MNLLHKLSIFSTVVILLSSSMVMGQTQNLEDVLNEKYEAFEALWNVSMNKVTIDSLEGELEHSRWQNTQTSSKTVKETGAVIIRHDKTGEIRLINLSVGGKSDVSLYLGNPAGTTIIGKFHTHPYEYDSLKDLPFSPRDFVDLYSFQRNLQLKNGYFSLIKSGRKYFALVVEDDEIALRFFRGQEKLARDQSNTLFDYLYKKFYSVNKGSSIQEIQLNSLLHIMNQSITSGIALYEFSIKGLTKLN